MTRLVAIVKGLGSALLLALFVAGVPAALVRIGAFPHSVPDLPTVWQALTGPDTSGRAVFAVLAAIVWLLWAAFTISVLREIGAAARTRGHRPVLPVGTPGPGWSARPAALLVTTIVAMFVAAPVLTAAAPHAAGAGIPGTPGAPGSVESLDGHRATAATTATAGQHPGPSQHTAQPPSRHAVSAAAGEPQQAGSTGHRCTRSVATGQQPTAGHTRYTVNRHDTLWSIAERQLGDPLRYHEIAALNSHLGPDFEIRTGQILTLPAAHLQKPAQGATGTGPAFAGRATAQAVTTEQPAAHMTVAPGDTFSGIAAKHGIPDWRTVWPANDGKAEPGGKYFTNPDHIEPGWDITLAGTVEAAPPSPAVATPAAAAPATTATSQPPAASQLAPGPQLPTPTPASGRHSPQDNDQPAAAVTEPPATGSTPTSTSRGASGTSAPARPAGDASGTSAAATGVDRTLVSGSSSSPSAGNEQQLAPSVTGFSAGGAILAAGVFGALALVRRQQFRDRRPGRSIAAAGPGLVPVERVTVTVGGPVAAQVARLDDVLCRVAAGGAETLPVTAVQLTGEDITVHLASAAVLADPWQPADTAGLVWRFPAAAETHTAGPDPDDTCPLAPYPTLVHVGSDATSSWLLDLEQVGGLVLTGDPTRCLDLARVMAAQLGVTRWADGVDVTLLGFGRELVDVAPSRLRYASGSDADAVLSAATGWAVRTADFADRVDLPVVDARRRAVADEAWLPHALLISADAVRADGDASPVAGLFELLAARPGATGTALVLVAADFDPGSAPAGATMARLDAAGTLTLTLPDFGLTLTASGWDEDTGRGVAMLLAHARTAPDEKIPDAAGEQPWQAYSDAAGALRDQLVQPRATPDVHDSARVSAACMLPLADEVYLEAAATTTADLNVLAPSVPAEVRPRVEQADPTLDEEVAAWFQRDCQRPRLSLLGPLTVRAPRVAAKQFAPYLEHVAYLATRQHGATVEQVADAFNIAPSTARKYVHKVRDLLRASCAPGEEEEEYLPHANKSAAGKARGVGVYELTGVLVDADLFLRLRLRGQTRGQQGIDDYATALRLVTGTPFAHLRGGAAWLIGGDRLDYHYAAAIVDVAHLVTTNALATGDTTTARAVVDIARLAAPHEEIPRLDAAAVADAEGNPDGAHQIVIDDVCNRTDDGLPPMELNERSKQILAHHRDWLSFRAS